MRHFDDSSVRKNQLNFDYKYLGYINNKTKLRKIYSETDIFISSSTEDAFPKTFAEAMLCRSAVICFEKTSVSKLINHKKNGSGAIKINYPSLEQLDLVLKKLK